MMLGRALPRSLLAVPLLALVTFVQLLYLESMRLRTRDLPVAASSSRTRWKTRIGLKTEHGAGTFSLIKHTLLVLLGVLYFAWLADGQPWHAAVFWQTVAAVWLTMVALSYALPQLLYRRTTGALAAAAGSAAARLGLARAPVWSRCWTSSSR